MDIQHLISQTLAYSWTTPVLVGIAALLLGLLIPRKAGTSWLTGILFFLPHLFLDLLDVVHTKKFKYYGLITALLSIEAFFAFRAATVYYDVLNTRMPAPEMAIVCVIVFVAIFLCGYMVATHGKFTFWSVCTMVFVIIHDWAGTVWMNYSTAATSTTSATIAAPDDPLKMVLTIGMCVLGLLPFIMGHWAEELRPQLEQELEEEVNAFTSTATRKIKRRAVERVLRLANHTNIVQLVRALPADEFTDFKRFVMPIIAEPGTPYNLPEPDEKKQEEEEEETPKQDTHLLDLAARIEALEMLQTPATGPDTDEMAIVAEEAQMSAPENAPLGAPQTAPENAHEKPKEARRSTPHSGEPQALRVVRRAMKNNPDMKPADLAKRARISEGYARKLRSKVLVENARQNAPESDPQTTPENAPLSDPENVPELVELAH